MKQVISPDVAARSTTSPIEFVPSADKSGLTAKMKLACCGVVFSHAAMYSTDPQAALSYWMREREARHRCDLVWEENPMGLFDRYAHLLPMGAPPKYKIKPVSSSSLTPKES